MSCSLPPRPDIVAVQEVNSTPICGENADESETEDFQSRALQGTEPPLNWEVTKCQTPFDEADHDLFFLNIGSGNATRNLVIVVKDTYDVPLDDDNVHVIGRATVGGGYTAPKPMLGIGLGGALSRLPATRAETAAHTCHDSNAAAH